MESREETLEFRPTIADMEFLQSICIRPSAKQPGVGIPYAFSKHELSHYYQSAPYRQKLSTLEHQVRILEKNGQWLERESYVYALYGILLRSGADPPPERIGDGLQREYIGWNETAVHREAIPPVRICNFLASLERLG